MMIRKSLQHGISVLLAVVLVLGSSLFLVTPAHAAVTSVDVYGQITTETWEGKITSDTQLVADAEAEAPSLADVSLTPDAALYDAYGGIKSMGYQGATGSFYAREINGIWWLITPEGYPYFMKGVDAVGYDESGYSTPINGANGQQQSAFTDLPDEETYAPAYELSGKVSFLIANLMKKYGSDWATEAVEVTVKRLRSWGFNSTGVWGWGTAIGLPYIEDLNLIGAAKINRSIDPFDPNFETVVRNSIATIRSECKTDPMLIGYAIENENGWNRSFLDVVLKRGDNCAAKGALIDFMIERHGSVAAVATLFESTAATRDDLVNEMLSVNGMPSEDVSAFVRLASERYHSVIAREIKAFDPNHMYWGDNLMVEQAGRDWIDGAKDYVDGFLLHEYDYDLQWTEDQLEIIAEYGKPAMLTEFSFVEDARGMPMYNPANTVDSQVDRGNCYRVSVESLVENPLVVGFSWFIYYDQPVTGRTLGGESYNFGLVNQCDQPYTEAIEPMIVTNGRVEDIHAGTAEAVTEAEIDGFIPPQPDDQFQNLVPGSEDPTLRLDLSAVSYYSGAGKNFRWKLDERQLPAEGWHNGGTWYAGDGKVFTNINMEGYLWSVCEEAPLDMFALQESADNVNFTDVELTCTPGVTNTYNEYFFTPTNGLKADTRYLRFRLNVTDPTVSFQNEIGCATEFTVAEDTSLSTGGIFKNLVEGTLPTGASRVSRDGVQLPLRAENKGETDAANNFNGANYLYLLDSNAALGQVNELGTWYAGDGNRFTDIQMIGAIYTSRTETSENTYYLWESADGTNFTPVELTHTAYVNTNGYKLTKITPTTGFQADTAYLRFGMRAINDSNWLWGTSITNETSFTIAKKHEHVLTLVPAKAATCKDAGHTAYYTCNCGKWFSDEQGATEITDRTSIFTSALGHTMGSVAAKEPSCTAPGNIAHYKCSVCNCLYSDQAGLYEITAASVVIPVIDHEMTAWNKEETGHQRKCVECGHLGELEPHAFIWVLDQAATATETGLKHEECTVCAYIRNENTVIPVQTCTHSMTAHEGVDATCTEEGTLTHWYCSLCEKYFTDAAGMLETDSVVIPALGHDAEFVAAKDATYTEDGNIAHWYCDRCQKCFSDEQCTTQLDDMVIPMLEYLHDDVFRNLLAGSQDPALVVDKSSPAYFGGSDYRYKLNEQMLPAAGWHAAGTWYAGECGTFTDIVMVGGLWVNSTKLPLEMFKLEASADNVTFTPVELASSSRANGSNYNLFNLTPTQGIPEGTRYLRFYLYVDNPSQSWVNQITDDTRFTIAFDHNVTKTTGTPSTCKVAGTIDYWTCSVCGKSFSDEACTKEVDITDPDALVAPLAPHTIQGWITDADNHWKACTVCDHTEQRAAHSFAWVLDQEPSGTTPGVKHEECTICDHRRNENTAVPPVTCAHDLTFVEASEPDCTNTGVVAHYLCSLCGKQFADAEGYLELDSVEVPPLGHSGEAVEAVAATYFEQGSVACWHCTRCGLYFSDEACTTELAEENRLTDPIPFADSDEIFRNPIPESKDPVLKVDTGSAANFNGSAYRYKLDESQSPSLGWHNGATWYAGVGNCFTDVTMVGGLWVGSAKTAPEMFKLYASSDNVTFTEVALTYTRNDATSNSSYNIYEMTLSTPLPEGTRYLQFHLNAVDGNTWQNQITDETTFVRDHVHAPVEVSAIPATYREKGQIAHWACEFCGEKWADAAMTTPLTDAEVEVARLENPHKSIFFNMVEGSLLNSSSVSRDGETLPFKREGKGSDSETSFNGAQHIYLLNGNAVASAMNELGTWYAGDGKVFTGVDMMGAMFVSRTIPAADSYALYESADGETFTSVALNFDQYKVCGAYTLYSITPKTELKEDTAYLRFGIFGDTNSGNFWMASITDQTLFTIADAQTSPSDDAFLVIPSDGGPGTSYGTLDEALEAAQFGETVKMPTGKEASVAVFETNGILDLNGGTLEVTTGYAKGQIMDSTGGNGVLKASKTVMQGLVGPLSSSGYIPFANTDTAEEANDYHIYKFNWWKESEVVKFDNNGNPKFRFTLQFDADAGYEAFGAQNDTTAFQFGFELKWTDQNGVEQTARDYHFASALLKGCADTKGANTLYVVIKGAAAANARSITVTPYYYVAGVRINEQPITYIVPTT